MPAGHAELAVITVERRVAGDRIPRLPSGHIRAQFGQSMAPGETLRLLNSKLIPRYQVSNYVAVAYLAKKI